LEGREELVERVTPRESAYGRTNILETFWTPVPASTFVIQLEKGGKPAGFLHARANDHEFVVVFPDFTSTREYLRREATKGAVATPFSTLAGFKDFLRDMQEQGTTHVGLYSGRGEAKTWPIPTLGDVNFLYNACAREEVKECFWLMPPKDGSPALCKSVEKHNGNIVSVPQLLNHLDDLSCINEQNAHVRAWFRGHAAETWELHPGVFREGFQGDTDAERLRLERHLTQDFRVMSAGLHHHIEESDLYFLQQHYRMPTRLLDWTNNPLAALYFAVTSHLDKDGAFFAMDAYNLGPTQQATFLGESGLKNFEGIADSRHPAFRGALRAVFRWEARDPPEFIMPVRPDYFDRRITLQRGCFTLHPPSKKILTVNENSTLKTYVIPMEKKQKIARQLAILGIDDFSVFGDLEHLSTSLKAAYGIDAPRRSAPAH
jgi:hypothetical protein